MELPYPPAWSPDSSEIAYITPTQTAQENSQVMSIYAIAPPVNGVVGEPRLLGVFEQQVGYGGLGFDPTEAIYVREAGFGGNALNFYWLTGDSFLFSPNNAGVGLSQFDTATGATTVITSQLARTSLNPTSSQAAGIVFEDGVRQLAIIDLLTGAQQSISLGEYSPDQVLWSADGQHLYMSAVDTSEILTLADGQTFYVHAVRLWEIALSTGESTLRFEQEGRGIGIMAELPGGGIVFSFVDGPRAWVQVVQNGGDMAAQRAAAPASWLMLLDSGGAVSQLGQGGNPAVQPQLRAAQG